MEKRSDNMKEIDGVKLYNVEDLSEILDIKERSIRRWLREGRIKGKKIGIKWYVADTFLKEFLLTPDSPVNNDEEEEEES